MLVSVLVMVTLPRETVVRSEAPKAMKLSVGAAVAGGTMTSMGTYSMSGQSEGNRASWAMVELLSFLRLGSGTFSHPRRSALTLVRGPVRSRR